MSLVRDQEVVPFPSLISQRPHGVFDPQLRAENGKIRLRGRSWLAERRGRSGQGNGLDRPFNCIFGLLKIHWRDRKRWVKLAG